MLLLFSRLKSFMLFVKMLNQLRFIVKYGGFLSAILYRLTPDFLSLPWKQTPVSDHCIVFLKSKPLIYTQNYFSIYYLRSFLQSEQYMQSINFFNIKFSPIYHQFYFSLQSPEFGINFKRKCFSLSFCCLVLNKEMFAGSDFLLKLLENI